MNFVVNICSSQNLVISVTTVTDCCGEFTSQSDHSPLLSPLRCVTQLVFKQKAFIVEPFIILLPRIFCINATSRSLRPAGEVQAANSWMFRAARLSVLIGAPGDEDLNISVPTTYAIAAPSNYRLNDVLADDMEAYRVKDYDEDLGWTFVTPASYSGQEVASPFGDKFANALIRRSVILSDSVYVIPKCLALVKDIAVMNI